VDSLLRVSLTSSPVGLRVAGAVLLAGVLAVWLVKPIGDPCPDLARLPQGATATSSPSFSPPLTRTCTYTAAAGVQVRASYVPWLDWVVLVLLAAAAGGAARMLSPGGRTPHRAERTPRAERPPKEARAKRPPRERTAGRDGERDASEREQARRERAERARRES